MLGVTAPEWQKFVRHAKRNPAFTTELFLSADISDVMRMMRAVPS